MNIIIAILVDRGGVAIATERDVQELRDEAYDRCHEAAADLNIYYSAALENLSLYSKFEPTPEAVREYLDDASLGDWRACMTQAAILATIGHLETQTEADLTKIEAAIREAALVGYGARKLYSSCAAGWCPHDREDEWSNGTLFTWRRLDGGEDAAMLRVSLSDGAEAWIDLRWIE